MDFLQRYAFDKIAFIGHMFFLIAFTLAVKLRSKKLRVFSLFLKKLPTTYSHHFPILLYSYFLYV